MHTRIPLLALALLACGGGDDKDADDTGTDTTAGDDTAPTGDTATPADDTGGDDTGSPPTPDPMDVTVTPAEPAAGEALTCAPDTQTQAIYRWEVDGTDAGIVDAEVPEGTTDAYQTWTCFAETVDGRFAGSGSVTTAETCRSLAVDGTDGWAGALLIGNTSLNRLRAPFTVELWVHRTTAGADQMILGKYALDSVDAKTDYALRFTADDQLAFVTGDPDVGGDNEDLCAVLETAAPSTGAWHHVAGTWDPGTGVKILWVDGQPTATCNTGTRPSNANGFLSVGFRLAGTTEADVLDGFVDEIRISDIVRYQGAFDPFTAPYRYFFEDGNTLGLWHLNAITSTMDGETIEADVGSVDLELDPDTTDLAEASACDAVP